MAALRLRKTFTTLTSILLTSTAAFTVVTPRAFAETFTMIPPKAELTANPGDVLGEKIRVRNESNAPVNYTASVEDFIAVGDDGGVDFVDSDDQKNTFALAKWINLSPSSFTIQPGGEQIVGYSIRVPKDAEPGGHFASVYVQSTPDAVQGGAAAVQSRLASLILLKVAGNVTEKLTLQNFRTSSTFFQEGPIEFISRSKNEGNVHTAPSGTITITNTIGRKTAEIPLKVANVFPGAERQVSTEWKSKRLLGRYTATLVGRYGQSNEPITSSVTFYVFPLWFVAVIFGVIFLIFLARINRKRLRKLLHRLTAE